MLRCVVSRNSNIGHVSHCLADFLHGNGLGGFIVNVVNGAAGIFLGLGLIHEGGYVHRVENLRLGCAIACRLFAGKVVFLNGLFCNRLFLEELFTKRGKNVLLSLKNFVFILFGKLVVVSSFVYLLKLRASVGSITNIGGHLAQVSTGFARCRSGRLSHMLNLVHEATESGACTCSLTAQ